MTDTTKEAAMNEQIGPSREDIDEIVESLGGWDMQGKRSLDLAEAVRDRCRADLAKMRGEPVEIWDCECGKTYDRPHGDPLPECPGCGGVNVWARVNAAPPEDPTALRAELEAAKADAQALARQVLGEAVEIAKRSADWFEDGVITVQKIQALADSLPGVGGDEDPHGGETPPAFFPPEPKQ